MDLFLSILSIILSGLLGIIVSIIYQRRSEKRKWKFMLLEQLMGNRYNIQGEKFSEALNSIFVVFYDSGDVITSLKSFHEMTMGVRTNDLANQKLLDLFKAMCKDLRINPKPLTDNFFLQPFNIRKE